MKIHPLWLAVSLLYMVFIWILSSRVITEVKMPPFPHADKVFHFVEYAILAFGLGKTFNKKNLMLAFVIATLYGAVDEYHQSFVPGRTADFFDFLVDALGAATVCLLFKIDQKKAMSQQAADSVTSL